MTQELSPPVPDLSAPAPDFDVREFARTAVGSHRAEIDLDAFDAEPLSGETVRVLAFLRSVEHATMNHLRDVLVTPSHKDARVTAFLTTWAYEKFWIADALSAVLAKHPSVVVGAQSLRHRIGGGVRAVIDRFSPIREALVANAIGDDVIAVHMTTGAVDTWLSQTAYSRVEATEPHPELTRVLERIREVKDRHLQFFAAQAEFRLGESAGARALTRKRMARAALPVGSDYQPRSEVSYFFSQLFDGAQQLLDEVDARIQALPGLDGLTLVRSRYEATA
ncbi:hypothetical protein QT381_01965 [Galbitalea sp. SE-J8]|uniref:hypothetical protein n=1 Tax=Galbitalea sp. SE-J8 TaxID=3054952 RepID=UPI00259CF46F|nr:hypothetical protein [Galbitalea sp. SE-J8]MDM4761769.1 hypothetical protein [Galbitalea sp. SE-J8]